ncbi:hypothetical protein GZ77_02815 [Endozoicomonas montiporae]|uniref:Uncharacterized protein n=2 Tax=Endozoicomonas montiporae TaxID=1027273 RepID=A0A081NAT9_9GAMM|nr:hypothetical protein [Endozoicomonas montiporae]AMO56742.1 hypothetical protein EZMO1_2680 [Endozoicomonas montiporae CL-33]KEQ15562.1 hypothetical protein GZ77_02815 [Endozoicomonas montiporae]
MTSSQILAGWGVYLAGVLACTIALWVITGSINPRVRRLMRVGLVALLVTPWWHSADVNLLQPALWVMIYDGLSSGFPEMARAGLPLVVVTAVSALIAASMPVSDKAGKKKPASTRKEKPSGHQPDNRQEPTL